MTIRRGFVAGVALMLALCGIAFAFLPGSPPRNAATATTPGTGNGGDTRLKVVASFSILADLTARVGGQRIALTTLVGPDGDAHAYEPTPVDARAVASADVVIVNGLGFEGWINRLIGASGYQGRVTVASRGVVPIQHAGGHSHEHGDDADKALRHGNEHPRHAARAPFPDTQVAQQDTIDPHAWQSVANARIYVANIAAALSAADPAGASIYAANATACLAELDALQHEIAAGLDALPADQRTVITSHSAFGYFAAAYRLNFIAPQGMSTQAEPSARDVAALIAMIKEHNVSAVFLENITDPRLLQRIAEETHARIGGTLYSDALSPPDGPAPTYATMMRHNTSQLISALQPPSR